MTQLGGRFLGDMAGSSGPEDYLIRRAASGLYGVVVTFHGTDRSHMPLPTVSGIQRSCWCCLLTGSPSEQDLLLGLTVRALVTTDYGRPSEVRRLQSIRLTSFDEPMRVGDVYINETIGMPRTMDCLQLAVPYMSLYCILRYHWTSDTRHTCSNTIFWLVPSRASCQQSAD